MSYQPVSVADAAAIAASRDKDIVIVLSVDLAHDKTHTTTYARAAEHKAFAAMLGDSLTQSLGCNLDQRTSYEDFRGDAEAARNAMLARTAVQLLAQINACVGNQADSFRYALPYQLRAQMADFLREAERNGLGRA